MIFAWLSLFFSHTLSWLALELSMKPEHTFTTTSADGTKLTLHRWNEEGTKNLFFIHGYVGHGNRFQDLAGSLVQQDIALPRWIFEGMVKAKANEEISRMWIRYQEDIRCNCHHSSLVAIAQGSGALALFTMQVPSLLPKGIVLANPLLGVQPSELDTKLILRVAKRLPFTRC